MNVNDCLQKSVTVYQYLGKASNTISLPTGQSLKWIV